jgi:protein SCO1/2
MRLAVISSIMIVVVVAAFIIFSRVINPPAETVNTGAAIVDSASVFTGGTPIDPPRQLPDFTLTNQTGDPISLSDLQGQIVLLYFGYTHCPDFCPNTMSDFKRVKAALAGDADKISFVLISVDGQRDTPEEMNTYLNKFDPDFIGMTGDEQEVLRIGQDYELYVEKQAGSSADDYMINHNPSIFMIDAQGRLVIVYMYGTEVEVITEDIQRMLS